MIYTFYIYIDLNYLILNFLFLINLLFYVFKYDFFLRIITYLFIILSLLRETCLFFFVKIGLYFIILFGLFFLVKFWLFVYLYSHVINNGFFDSNIFELSFEQLTSVSYFFLFYHIQNCLNTNFYQWINSFFNVYSFSQK